MIIEHGVSIIAHSYIIIEVKLHWKKIRELEKLVLYNTILPVHFTGFTRLHGDKKIPLFLIWWAVGERVLYSLVNWAVRWVLPLVFSLLGLVYTKIQLHTAAMFFQVVVALFKLPSKYLHFWCLADPLFWQKQSQKRSTGIPLQRLQ